MTRPEIEEIVRIWQERFKLDRWDIKVRWEMPVELGYDAEIKISDDYEQASIRIQQLEDTTGEVITKPYTSWTREEANGIIVHELLHIFEKQTRRPLEKFIPDEDPTQAQELLWDWYVHAAENWVDRLASIIVDLAGIA